MIKIIIGAIVSALTIAVGKKAYSHVSGECFADMVIEFANNVALVTKGTLSSRALNAVARVLIDEGVQSGTIEIKQNGKVTFTWEIPERCHQRLRNIILNA